MYYQIVPNNIKIVCDVFPFYVGECVVFDNHRVLHGRVGYTLDPRGGTRFYNGCYADWDEVLSTLNLLRVKLGIPS